MRVNIEFRLRKNSGDHRNDQLLGRIVASCVPDVGELVNLDGNPFIVVERGWAATTYPLWLSAIAADGDIYAYLSVVPAATNVKVKL